VSLSNSEAVATREENFFQDKKMFMLIEIENYIFLQRETDALCDHQIHKISN